MHSIIQENIDKLPKPDGDDLIAAIEADDIDAAVKLCATVKIYDISPGSRQIPFFVAINKNNKKMIESLLTNAIEDAVTNNACEGYRKHYFIGKALYMAVALNEEDMVRELLKLDDCPIIYLKSSYEQSLLHMAAFRGNLPIAILLIEGLKHSVYPNYIPIIDKERGLHIRNIAPIYLAALSGNEELVNYLDEVCSIVQYTQINYRYEALCRALRDNEKEAAHILCKPYGSRYLSIALNKDNFGLAKFLLPTLANVNSMLRYAVLSDDKKMVEFLCENGVDVNAIIEGETPLYSAICNNKFEIAKILIKKFNADINIIMPGGDTALNRAMGTRNLELVGLLEEELFHCEIFEGSSVRLSGTERLKQLLSLARKLYLLYNVSYPVEYMSAMLGGEFKEAYCFKSSINMENNMNKNDIKNILMSDNENKFIEFLNSIQRKEENLGVPIVPANGSTYTPYLQHLRDEPKVNSVNSSFDEIEHSVRDKKRTSSLGL